MMMHGFMNFINDMVDVFLSVLGGLMIAFAAVLAVFIFSVLMKGFKYTRRIVYSSVKKALSYNPYTSHRHRHHRGSMYGGSGVRGSRGSYRVDSSRGHWSGGGKIVVEARTPSMKLSVEPSRVPIDIPWRSTNASCKSEPISMPSWVSSSIIGVDLSDASCCLIGCGGWGCVYRCSVNGVNYALKTSRTLRDSIEGGGDIPTLVESARTPEASWVHSLRHPNLVRVLGYSKVLPITVYEYAGQGSLRPYISKGLIKGRNLVHAGIHVASGLRYLHTRGLIHGDVKPENILVFDGILKLGDYNSVRNLLEDLERQTISSSSIRSQCTPGYCAPEQVYADLARKARLEGYEDRVDVYQMGILLLEASSGRVIDGSKRVGMPESDLDRYLAGVEPAIRGLIYEMISENPWDRPSSDEVLRRLVRLYGSLV